MARDPFDGPVPLMWSGFVEGKTFRGFLLGIGLKGRAGLINGCDGGLPVRGVEGGGVLARKFINAAGLTGLR